MARKAGLGSDGEVGLSTSSGEWRSGWRVLLAASTGFGMTFGLFVMTAGIFIAPMQQEFGWSRTALAIGPMVALISGPLNLVVGILIRRFGARRVSIIGALLLASGILMISFVPAVPLLLYALVLFIAITGTLTSAPAYITGVVTWFERNAGTAIGITLAGVSVVSVVAYPSLAYIIENYGWRAGYLGLAFFVLLPIPLLILWFRERKTAIAVTPASGKARRPESTISDALRDLRFWLLIVAIGSAATAIGGFLSQLVPILVSRDFTFTAAAALGSTFALSIGIGRVIAGFLLDHLKPNLVAATCLGLPAIGVMILARLELGPEVGLVPMVAVALIGLAQGAEVDFLAFYTLRLFGQHAFPVILSVLMAINSCVLALGGLLFARLFDFYGNYQVALYFSMAAFLVSASIILTIRLPTKVV